LSTPSQPAADGRFPHLDGLRGIAILLVMVFHMVIMPAATPPDVWVRSAAAYGWVGVDLFFALSGFLITSILLRGRRRGGRGRFLWRFWARRALRIFPLYYGVLVLALVVLPQFDHPKAAAFQRIQGDELWYWLYLSNFSIAAAGAFRHGILDISWSLAIEEQFYLLWPAVVLLAPVRWLKWICLAGVGLSLAARAYMVQAGWHPIAVYVHTLAHLDPLLLGALGAVLLQEGAARAARRLAWIFTGAGVLWLAALAAGGPGAAGTHPAYVPGLTALGAGFALLVVRAAGGAVPAWMSRLLDRPWLVRMGLYSYAMYLFHLPLRALLRDTLYPPQAFATLWGSPLPGQLLFLAAGISLSYYAAKLSWHLYESRFLALKRWLPYR